MSEPCLCCGMPSTDDAHFPIHRGMGGRPGNDYLPMVRLCHKCHMSQHAGNERTILTLICKAPGWWQSKGEWTEAEPFFRRYMARREYREAVGG